jgi:hypothetical protein
VSIFARNIDVLDPSQIEQIFRKIHQFSTNQIVSLRIVVAASSTLIFKHLNEIQQHNLTQTIKDLASDPSFMVAVEIPAFLVDFAPTTEYSIEVGKLLMVHSNWRVRVAFLKAIPTISRMNSLLKNNVKL